MLCIALTMLLQYICLSVRLYVTHRYCVQTTKRIMELEYRGTAGPGPLTSAILPSYAPINHQPMRLDVTYDVIGNPHYPYVIVDLGLQLTLQPED